MRLAEPTNPAHMTVSSRIMKRVFQQPVRIGKVVSHVELSPCPGLARGILQIRTVGSQFALTGDTTKSYYATARAGSRPGLRDSSHNEEVL
jgi:hypothetical protein